VAKNNGVVSMKARVGEKGGRSVELTGGNNVMIRSEEGSRSSSRRTTTSFAA
jgi:hypothetical protein